MYTWSIRIKIQLFLSPQGFRIQYEGPSRPGVYGVPFAQEFIFWPLAQTTTSPRTTFITSPNRQVPSKYQNVNFLRDSRQPLRCPYATDSRSTSYSCKNSLLVFLLFILLQKLELLLKAKFSEECQSVSQFLSLRNNEFHIKKMHESLQIMIFPTHPDNLKR